MYKSCFASSWFRGPLLALLLMAIASACAPMGGKTPDSGSTMPASIMEPYLAIQEALAQDSTDQVKANAGNIATAATSLGAPAMKIDTTALQLAGSLDAEQPDIKAVRDRFGALSEAIDTYMTGLNLKAPEGVKVAWCPMVKKPWLQKGETLANPYYGKEMLACGNFR
jgi:membrane fusion protein, copper/silver efflux system